MRDFFQGWRRKIGCITVVIAVVLASGWLRSCARVDSVECHLGKSSFLLRSKAGTIGYLPFESGTAFVSLHGRPPHWLQMGPEPCSLTFASGTEVICYKPDPSCLFVDIDSGMGMGAGTDGIELKDSFRAPYWSLIAPLTLLSAFLFLWKPSKGAERPCSRAGVKQPATTTRPQQT